MQNLPSIGALAALAALAAFPCAARPGDFVGAARLVRPVTTPLTMQVGGVNWRCADQACLGAAKRFNTLDSLLRECRRFTAAVGPVSAYASRGERLSRLAIADCNAAARSLQTASR